MKTQFQTAFAAATLAALPLTASADVVTRIEAWAGFNLMSYNSDTGDDASDVDLGDTDYLLGGIDLSFGVPTSGSTFFQFDLGGLVTGADDDRTFGDDANLGNHYYAGAHIGTSRWEDFTVGAFVYYASAYGHENGDQGDPDIRGAAWAGGVEGTYDLNPNSTLFGQIGYFDSDEENRTEHSKDVVGDAFFVRADMRHYPDDISRWLFGLSYMSGQSIDTDIGDPPCIGSNCLDIVGYSAEVRYDRTIAPQWDAFAAAEYNYVGQTGPDSAGQCCEGVSETRLTVGVVRTFGATGLRARDRATPYTTPEFDRWLGYTTEVIDTGN